MFARQTSSQLLSLAFALFTTVGMLGAVDSLASHPAEDTTLMAQQPHATDALQCPVQG